MRNSESGIPLHQAAVELAIIRSLAKTLWVSTAIIAVAVIGTMLLLESLGKPMTVWIAALDVFLLAAITLPILNAVLLRPMVQKSVELATAASEARFQSVAQAVQEGIVVFGTDRKIRFVNRAAADMHGYAAERVRGQAVELLMPEGVKAQFQPDFECYLRTREGSVIGKGLIETAGLRSDGRQFAVEMSVSELKSGKESEFVVVLRDITQRKATEEALRQSEERLRAILEASRDGIVVEDNEIITYANLAFARLHGYDGPSELVGQHVSIVKAPRDKEKLLEYGRKRLRGEPVPYVYEFQALRKDGSTVDLEASVSTGRVAGSHSIVTVLHDLQERKRLQLYEQILPVCCMCGKIRNDEGAAQGQGDWERLDHYVARHSDAQVSHTFCPECLKEYRRREGLG